MDKLRGALITAATVSTSAFVLFAIWYIGSTTLFTILSEMGD